MKNHINTSRSSFSKSFKIFTACCCCLIISNTGIAQGTLEAGQAALEDASAGISGYYDTVQNIIYAIAGIIALLGAIRTFMKWNMGDPDVMSSAAAWFGSAIFLIVAISMIGTLFVG